MATKPVTNIDQFMFAGLTSAKLGQKLKNSTKERYAQAKTLFAMPRRPGILHGPHKIFVFWESVGLLADTLLAGTISPVHRRYSNSEATNRYDEKRPAMETEMIPLNAVDEPMLTSASTHAIRVVVATDIRHPGRPLSREKAQKTRDEDANRPTVAEVAKQNINDAITAAAAVEFVACLKIAINGYAGFSASAASMSPAR
ncbi:uncharacterized protein N0V89_009481 [Didymosphaeria variabile]|uniref:Uncharacterized protein n=1 Tax=Didymosphaeria variabile TaxID=1932322 RepID=A0A9W8XEF2_9PLEO|nr:uncharacterized protein N0V89_009481 [Didymosphaeria variabile]KAJ4348109.1 hypothetical protein N0V89_009481 [Didymosphaeria variabile]